MKGEALRSERKKVSKKINKPNNYTLKQK